VPQSRGEPAATGEEPAIVTPSEPPVRLRKNRSEGFELRGPSTPLPELLVELWRSRRVLGVLARKDFYARYRRTSFGMLWAVGLPLVQAAVLAAVFSRVGNFSSALRNHSGLAVSFPVFIYAGMTAWSFFTNTMPNAATAIVDNGGLARKIYFPRALLPLLVVTTGVYPLAISAVVLLVMALALVHHVGPSFLWVVPGCLLAVAITAGFGLLLSALHVYFRDVRFIVQALMSVLFYLSPIIYSLQSAPGALGSFVLFSPMTGPIELMRLGVGAADPNWASAVGLGCGWFLITGAIGLVLQSRYDRVFVDLM
jgi:ABC-type polysaccharide/polyol phosphate export permease